MCNYCEEIKNATPASPRKKYNYCPMCGRKLNLETNKQKYLMVFNYNNRPYSGFVNRYFSLEDVKLSQKTLNICRDTVATDYNLNSELLVLINIIPVEED